MARILSPFPGSRLVFARPRTTVPAMLSDRPYMRGDYPRERTSVVVWLLAALIAGFAIQTMSAEWLKSGALEESLALSAATLRQGHFWTLVSYPFLHRGVLHVLMVGLALFFVGREVVGQIGERRLAWLTLYATLAGGLSWLAFHFQTGGDLLGATSILCCYFTVLACLFPNREMSFLVFFVIPVRLRPKYLAWTLLGVSLLGVIATEILSVPLRDYNVPHSAHLGAMLAGWIYYRHFYHTDGPSLVRSSAGSTRGKPRASDIPVAESLDSASPNGSNKLEMRAQVDRILDKINSHGFGALTAEEKRVLADARDTLSRR